MPACPNCGRENADDARFCSWCATPFAVADQREERKTVSVVFADLVGSTARAERLDPEDVRSVLAPYHARLRRELERFGGTVEKFIGDAVVGVFGAPITHEDDPERAVRAALAIQDAIAELNEADPALELEVRVGVSTGEALVALGARPERGEGMVSGDVMNTGARLQAAAPVGGVLVGESTYRATERVIDYQEAGPIEAKGKSEPLPTWVAVAPRASFGIDLSETGAARLVGRDRELELLAGALNRVRETDEPQLVTLVGVPGIGKSRLVRELFRIIEAETELTYWRQGRSLPYGEGIAYWALGEMVKAQAGILESDDRDVAATKLDRAVEDLGLDADQVAWLQRHLRPLVGLVSGDDASAERSEVFAAWRRLIEALAEKSPAVFVFEDLQWADDGMLDFVDELVDWIAGVPLLVVATARPELLERRPGWGGGKRNALTISLAPLSDTETARLLADLLERAVLPVETQTALLARAAGNPLFAEEYARMLSAGSVESEVPDSLQAIVAARVDGLPAHEKTMLQAGSVLGKVFWTDAVATLVGQPQEPVQDVLRPLERKEFIRRERRSAVAGGEQYTFVHALVRDVVYGQMPRHERSRWHLLAADWIESLPPDRSEDRAEVLAHHLLRSLEYERAGGGSPEPALVDRAAAACREAGERAWALGAYAAAARYFGDALDLGGEDAALLLARGRAFVQGGVLAGEAELERSSALFQAAGDSAGAAEAQAELSQYHWRRGAGEASTEHMNLAIALIRDVPPSRARASVLARAARSEILAGHTAEGLRLAEEAAELASRLAVDEVRASALSAVALAKSSLMEPDCISALEEALAVALETSPSESARGYINLASTLVTFGADVRRARDVHRQGLVYTERFGLAWQHEWIRGELAMDGYRLGDWDEAVRLADEIITAAERSPHYMESAARYARSSIRAARGDREGAVADAARMVELGREIGDPQTREPTLATAAYVNSLVGAPAAARSLLAELLASLEDRGPGPIYEPWYALELAVALRSSGADRAVFDAAHGRVSGSAWFTAAAAYLDQDFERAADLMRELGALPYEAAARLAAAEAHLAAGRRAEANVHLAAALGFYRRVGATALITAAERLLPAAG